MKTIAHGFTLIELTIVLALIALLLTIAVPRYFHAVDHGKLAVQRQNLAAMRDAIDKYFGDVGRYPDDLQDLVKKKYLRSIPLDPVTSKPEWNIIAPEDQTLGRVFDVASTTTNQADLTNADSTVAKAPANESKAAGGAAPRGTNAR